MQAFSLESSHRPVLGWMVRLAVCVGACCSVLQSFGGRICLLEFREAPSVATVTTGVNHLFIHQSIPLFSTSNLTLVRMKCECCHIHILTVPFWSLPNINSSFCVGLWRIADFGSGKVMILSRSHRLFFMNIIQHNNACSLQLFLWVIVLWIEKVCQKYIEFSQQSLCPHPNVGEAL